MAQMHTHNEKQIHIRKIHTHKDKEKMPSEMEIAPRYTLLELFTLLILFKLLELLKLLYIA